MQHSGSSPQHFCLRWNNYQSNLTSVFDQLLQSESFVDVTLACDGHSVKAHKMVLSACSPYFQSLFFENPCQHPIVIMRDIKWPELKAAVEFMYKGEINVSQEQIGPLLKVAESLKIRGLADVNGETEALAANEIPRKTPPINSRRDWDSTRTDLSEDAMTPSPAVTPFPRSSKKRRHNSIERSSHSSRSSPADSLATDTHENTTIPADLSPIPPPPPTPVSTPTLQHHHMLQQQHTANALAAAAAAVSQSSSIAAHSPAPIQPPPSSMTPTMSVSVCSNNSGERSTPVGNSSHLPPPPGVVSALQEQMSQLSQMNLPPPPPPSHHQLSHEQLSRGLLGGSGNSLHGMHPDDMEIKPGIAEMIREEERVSNVSKFLLF